MSFRVPAKNMPRMGDYKVSITYEGERYIFVMKSTSKKSAEAYVRSNIEKLAAQAKAQSAKNGNNDSTETL